VKAPLINGTEVSKVELIHQTTDGKRNKKDARTKNCADEALGGRERRNNERCCCVSVQKDQRSQGESPKAIRRLFSSSHQANLMAMFCCVLVAKMGTKLRQSLFAMLPSFHRFRSRSCFLRLRVGGVFIV